MNTETGIASGYCMGRRTLFYLLTCNFKHSGVHEQLLFTAVQTCPEGVVKVHNIGHDVTRTHNRTVLCTTVNAAKPENLITPDFDDYL